MSELSAFFAQNVSMEITEEHVVSERFKDKDGIPLKWKIKSLTEGENENLRRSSTKRVKVQNGINAPEMDANEYMLKLAVACVVFPDLKNAELQASYGVMGADALIKKMLRPGEYAELLSKVQSVNGYDQSVEGVVSDIKNG